MGGTEPKNCSLHQEGNEFQQHFAALLEGQYFRYMQVYSLGVMCCVSQH
jgi:hypothetical protein